MSKNTVFVADRPWRSLTVRLWLVIGEVGFSTGWLRFGGPTSGGIAWKPRNARAYFSERNGYVIWRKFLFWRFSLIRSGE